MSIPEDVITVNGVEVVFRGDPVKILLLCVDMFVTLNAAQDATGAHSDKTIVEAHEDLAPVPRQDSHSLPVPRPLPVTPRVPASSGHVSVPFSD